MADQDTEKGHIKYAVEIEEIHVKEGEFLNRGIDICPKCKTKTNIWDSTANVPICKNCGTEPFEAK